MRVRAVGVDDAAVGDRGIQSRRLQNQSDHGRRRRFAVRAADRDRPFQAHQFRQHFGAAHYGYATQAGFFDFDVFGIDGGGNDDDARMFNVFGGVSDDDVDALRAQTFDV